MSVDAVVTLVVLVAMFAGLTRDRFPPALVLLSGLVVLVLTGVIDVEAAFAGFGSTAPLTVAVLYVVAHGARRTGLLAPMTSRLLAGDGGTATVLRFGVPVAAVSSVFNNTPLVAMLVPEVVAWSRRTGVAASRLLMPLSFATILGGTITVIGTSTNLVVSGVLEQQGMGAFGFLELAPIGIPVAISGLLVLAVVGIRFLPDRRDPVADAQAALRDYAMHLHVAPGGPLVGRSVADAGLRNLTGVFLADILRDDRRLGPVSPDEVLADDDLLVFVGDVDGVLDLRNRPGLSAPPEQADVLARARAPRYYDVVIGRGSPLIGQTLRDVGIREGYQAAAVAIHRAGAALEGRLGDVELHAGDLLVVFADRDLQASRRAQEDFLLVAPVDQAMPVVTSRAPVVALALLAFVVLAATGIVGTLEAALVAAGILVVTRTVRFSEAKRAIDLDVVLLVATALGIGRAVEDSGLAQSLADSLTGSLGGLGTFGIVLGLMLTTTLLTEIVTNNAAAAVIVPIALRAAVTIGIDPRVMAVGIAVMASSSFLTPIGYQTNAMVYGPGGYRFGDFVRVGGLVNLTVTAVTVAGVMLLG